MASRIARSAYFFFGSGNFSYSRSIKFQAKVLRKSNHRLIRCRLPYCTSASNPPNEVKAEIVRPRPEPGVVVRYEHGLPVITMPLPSRREKCQFTLRPITDTVGDFLDFIQQEDKGVDRVAIYNSEGLRIARSTSIDLLLRNEFELVLNDFSYHISPPDSALSSSEHVTELSEVKNKIAELFSVLNVDKYQVEREQELLAKLENLKTKLEPLEKVKRDIEERAEKRTRTLSWLGLGMMGLQFGVLARLTWWEYSWDIMEPVTYFVTYGTSMGMFAYYVCTKQEYNFAEVRDREYLLTVHKQANKASLDLLKYNRLRDAISQTEYDLQRLRDPLQMNLPIQHVIPSHLSKEPHPVFENKK